MLVFRPFVAQISRTSPRFGGFIFRSHVGVSIPTATRRLAKSPNVSVRSAMIRSCLQNSRLSGRTTLKHDPFSLQLGATKLASLGSMFITIGTYSVFFGFPYAFGMVGLILVHETGHALIMLHRGIPFSPMVFMPFMGAVIAMKNQPRDAWEDALVAFGGPVLGSMGAGAVAVAAHSTDSQLLYA